MLLQGAGYVYFESFHVKAIGSMGYPVGLFIPHDDLDYLYTPNYRGHFMGGPYHDIEVAINKHGFRDDEFAEKGSRYRMLVLGDSVVFGSGMKKENRFTEQLENSAWAKVNRIEVLNLGVSSYTFSHYLKLAQLHFFDLQPALVIVGFTLNDIAAMDEAWPARRYGRYREKSKNSKPDWVRRVQHTLDRTYAGRFTGEVKSYWKALTMGAEEHYHTKWMRSVNRRWRKLEDKQRLFGEIDAFDALLKRQKIPYMFLVFPEANDLRAPTEFDYPRQEITKFLKMRHILYCDGYNEFSRYTGDLQELFLRDDSVHFTTKGHQLVSEIIQYCFEENVQELHVSK